jgi:hypothetical protein
VKHPSPPLTTDGPLAHIGIGSLAILKWLPSQADWGELAISAKLPHTLASFGEAGAMDSVNVSEMVARLGAEEESVRKMAVFKLQNAIGDPSFADVFIYEGGLPKLRFLALHSTGNTLAYCLTSLARLLELDKGWDHVTDDLVARVRQGDEDA